MSNDQESTISTRARSAVGSGGLFSAAKLASDIIVSECINKHQIDPRTDSHLYPDDWHLEITITFGEVKALAAAVSEAGNVEERGPDAD